MPDVCKELQKKWERVTSDINNLLANRIYMGCLAEEFNRPERQKIDKKMKEYILEREGWSEKIDVDPDDFTEAYYQCCAFSQEFSR